MNDLKITLIQANLHWENKKKNLDMFSNKIKAISESTDLIVLPEMFSTGFSMDSKKLAETMNGATVSWMRTMAAKKNCAITGSFICEEDGNYFNRMVWMNPDGKCTHYNKRHLFRMGNENNYYSPGENKIIVDLKGWKICPLICYDLRFPVWSRQKLEDRRQETDERIQKIEYKKNEYQYDVLIYIANWPQKRAHPWKTLLLARAIENQCYVVGLNRVGNDGNNFSYSGNSAIINAEGKIISNINPFEESIETITIHFDELESFRKSFPAILDADYFEVKG
jgi:omega-amidase